METTTRILRFRLYGFGFFRVDCLGLYMVLALYVSGLSLKVYKFRVSGVRV